LVAGPNPAGPTFPLFYMDIRMPVWDRTHVREIGIPQPGQIIDSP